MNDSLAATARGTPMECPPPSTRDTVGLRIPEIISAMARPASMSPPMVLSRMSRPSASSLSSTAVSRGRTCSYLVVLAPERSSWWPSMVPTMVRVWMVPSFVLTVLEPRSTMSCRSWSCSSFSPFSAGLVSSVMEKPPFAVAFPQKGVSIRYSGSRTMRISPLSASSTSPVWRKPSFSYSSRAGSSPST